jgi:aspartyl-tRNA synthetase
MAEKLGAVVRKLGKTPKNMGAAVGSGIDRPMLLGQGSIRDVILFPQLKPK